jgi:hypothetical protein
MGAVISYETTVAPVSYASIIVGFLSFAFTLATAVRVFWSELQTFNEADSEIFDWLSTLKQGLYEEKRQLGRARQLFIQNQRLSHKNSKITSFPRARKGYSNPYPALHSMHREIKHYIEQFRIIERPFLKTDEEYQRHKKRIAAKKLAKKEKATNTNDNLERQQKDDGTNIRPHVLVDFSDEEEDDDNNVDYDFNPYRKSGLHQRHIWLRRKRTVISMSELLARTASRRMSLQVASMAMYVRIIFDMYY